MEDDVLELLNENWSRLDSLEMNDEQDYLRHCLEQLTDRARRLVRLKYFEGKGGAEIARIVGIKVHSVYVSLNRIHRALEDCIRRRREEVDYRHA